MYVGQLLRIFKVYETPAFIYEQDCFFFKKQRRRYINIALIGDYLDSVNTVKWLDHTFR